MNFTPTGLNKVGSDGPDVIDIKFSVLKPKATDCPFLVTPKKTVIKGRSTQIFDISFSSEIETFH